MEKKTFSFGHCPNHLNPSPPCPQFGQLGPFFSDVKNDVLAHITERSKDDYDNDVSDNCDHNFGTFDDFGVKNDQKVSNNMILMSKYKGKHGGKKGQKIWAWVDPPPSFRQCPKETVFFHWCLPLDDRKILSFCRPILFCTLPYDPILHPTIWFNLHPTQSNINSSKL